MHQISEVLNSEFLVCLVATFVLFCAVFGFGLALYAAVMITQFSERLGNVERKRK